MTQHLQSSLSHLISLHAQAVDLLHNKNDPCKALVVFQDVIRSLRELLMAEYDHRSASGFRLYVECLAGTSEDNFISSGVVETPPMVVKELASNGMTKEDETLFSVTALYNIGLCYHVKGNLVRAGKFYKVALGHLQGTLQMADSTTISQNYVMVASFLCNNLAAIHAEFFDSNGLRDCLKMLQNLLEHVDPDQHPHVTMLYANLLHWNSFNAWHASVA